MHVLSGGFYAKCDNANPNGSQAGSAFFGGLAATGLFHVIQAEFARIPYAAVTCVKLPDQVTDQQAIMISDIWRTGWFGADIASVGDVDSVAVFGCGPIGQFAIASAFVMGAGHVFAVDNERSRAWRWPARGAPESSTTTKKSR